MLKSKAEILEHCKNGQGLLTVNNRHSEATLTVDGKTFKVVYRSAKALVKSGNFEKTTTLIFDDINRGHVFIRKMGYIYKIENKGN